MSIVNSQSGTRIDEIAEDLYRISTPLPPSVLPGGFTFNQFLLVDEDPLLFHTGPRTMFPLLREAIETVLPLSRLRWIAFGHVESDECGAIEPLLGVAPEARLLGGSVQAMLAFHDLSDRTPKVLGDGEAHSIGKRTLQWIDAPHVPHGWDNGFLFEQTARTLFAGDLFTQPGSNPAPLTEGDVLGPSEAMRSAMDYYAHAPSSRTVLDRLAALDPTLLACMHGSTYRGDGAQLLRALGERLG